MLPQLYDMLAPYDRPQKIYILRNKILSLVANVAMPILYKINPIYRHNYDYTRNDIVVTLTSFPGRIKQAEKCIQSLLRQTVKPYKIILWLADDEYPSIQQVPENLRTLQKFGLEIRFCENLKSYKKIYYTAELFNQYIIVTADDDFYYPPNWLEELITVHEKFPHNVICHRSHRILFDSNHKLVSYGKWDWYSNGYTGPSHWLHTLTGAGALFPERFFQKDFFDIETIKECCPTTDDFWIKVYCLRNNVEIVKVKPISKELINIHGSQVKSLISINQAEGNDIAFDKLLKHYKIDLYDFLSVTKS